MTTVPDFIYERSVVKQLALEGVRKERFPDNGREATITKNEDANVLYAEASSVFYFEKREKLLLREEHLASLQRRLMCKGAGLRDLRTEITFMGKFLEEKLRRFSHSLGEMVKKLNLNLRGVGVHKAEGGEGILLHLIGGGELRSVKETPWQQNILIPKQGIVITGSIGRAGSLKLFNQNEEVLTKAFPKVFLEKMRNRIGDRLPYLELENAPFFGVTALSYGEEGGLLAALFRLGDREKAGLKIYAERLFYDQETIELAEFFDRNPLEISSEGVYVMAVSRAEDFVESLRAAGLPAVLAGEVTEEKKRVIVFGEEERFIESPRF